MTLSPTPSSAMLLAAGLGLRMRPLTLTQPKPLVRVGGKALIDWTLDALAAMAVPRAVVNVHHFGQMIAGHVAARRAPKVSISDETECLLDTGGGIVKALPLLGQQPFFVFNCDGIILGGSVPALERLANAWDDALDVVMLLHPRARARGFDGAGDFFLNSGGSLARRGAAAEAPFVYAGAYIVHPRVFASERAVPFSMNRIWDSAIARQRMRGVVHDGEWFHVGTPAAVTATDALLAELHAGV